MEKIENINGKEYVVQKLNSGYSGASPCLRCDLRDTPDCAFSLCCASSRPDNASVIFKLKKETHITTKQTDTQEDTIQAQDILTTIAKMIPGGVSESGKIQYNQIISTLATAFPTKQTSAAVVDDIKIGDSVILMPLSKDEKDKFDYTPEFMNTVANSMLKHFGTGDILTVRDVRAYGITFEEFGYYYPPQLCHKVKKPSEFKVGMTVELVDIPGSKSRFNFTEGYENTWVETMSDYIGKTGIVVSVCETTGIVVNFLNKINYAYPAQMLKIVSTN